MRPSDALRETPIATVHPRAPNRSKPPQQGEIVLQRLAEPVAGIDGEALRPDARRPARLHAAGEEGEDFLHHIAVAGRRLHGFGPALHVDEDGAGARLRDETEGGRVGGERRNVVGDGGSGGERGAQHLRMAGIDRDRNAVFRERGHDRQDAPAFLGVIDLDRSRAGGLAADIDDIGARRRQRLPVPDGGFRIEPVAAVGKAVRASR